MTHDPKYPSVGLCADIIVRRPHGILLIRRKNDPFKDAWALPGGFLNENETARDAASRELLEETGLFIPPGHMKPIGYFDAPFRDPRGRTVSFAFLAITMDSTDPVAADDAKEARWFHPTDLPQLAFDHADIIKSAI